MSASEEAPHLESFIKRLRKLRAHKRAIITSREQVLRQASQANSEPLVRVTDSPMSHLVALSSYNVDTRAKILFNHIYFSELKDDERVELARDSRILNLVHHHSFNPRIIATITERVHSDTKAADLLEDLIRTFNNPEELLKVSFRSLREPAISLLLTMATLPPRPVRIEELRELTGESLTSLEWKFAWQSIEPAWVSVSGVGSTKSLSFANPSCRDFLIGTLDDADMTRERIRHITRIEQLLSLTVSAGLLPDSRHTQGSNFLRSELAAVLMENRADLTNMLRGFVEEKIIENLSQGAELRLLRDAATLLTVYATPDSTSWIWDHVNIIGTRRELVPTIDGLALASRLIQLPADPKGPPLGTIHHLVRRAVFAMGSLQDLDAYEMLPEVLHDLRINEIARTRAVHVIQTALADACASTQSPEFIKETPLDLNERADWYGIQLDIAAVMEHLDGAFSNDSDESIIWPRGSVPPSTEISLNSHIRSKFSQLNH